MELQIWVAYVSTVLVLMGTPGPSQLLMLSNSIRHGFRRTLFSAAGDLSANFLQMVVASVGLVSVIRSSREFFLVVKWAGVAYLIYLGLKLLLSEAPLASPRAGKARSSRSLYLQGFMTSAANPKAVVFFAALFPQFIDPSRPLVAQFLVLSCTYLTMDAVFLSLYGYFAEWIGGRLLRSAGRRLNQVAGALLIGAAVLLGLKDVEAG